MSNVVMVTGPNCPNCDMLKLIIKHMGFDPATEYQVGSQEAADIITQTAARGIPVLARMDGDKVADYMIGSHNDNKVKEIYNGN